MTWEWHPALAEFLRIGIYNVNNCTKRGSMRFSREDAINYNSKSRANKMAFLRYVFMTLQSCQVLQRYGPVSRI